MCFAFYLVCLQVFDVVRIELVRKIIIVAMREVGENMVGLLNLRKVVCE